MAVSFYPFKGQVMQALPAAIHFLKLNKDFFSGRHVLHNAQACKVFCRTFISP